MVTYRFCKYEVCRGVQIHPLYLITQFWNLADHPVNYHLYTSENDGSQTTNTFSKPTLPNGDSGEGQKQTNLGGDGMKPLDNFELWHSSFSSYS